MGSGNDMKVGSRALAACYPGGMFGPKSKRSLLRVVVNRFCRGLMTWRWVGGCEGTWSTELHPSGVRSQPKKEWSRPTELRATPNSSFCAMVTTQSQTFPALATIKDFNTWERSRASPLSKPFRWPMSQPRHILSTDRFKFPRGANLLSSSIDACDEPALRHFCEYHYVDVYRSPPNAEELTLILSDVHRCIRLGSGCYCRLAPRQRSVLLEVPPYAVVAQPLPRCGDIESNPGPDDEPMYRRPMHVVDWQQAVSRLDPDQFNLLGWMTDRSVRFMDRSRAWFDTRDIHRLRMVIFGREVSRLEINKLLCALRLLDLVEQQPLTKAWRPMGMWVPDLTCFGVEPNPGPVVAAARNAPPGFSPNPKGQMLEIAAKEGGVCVFDTGAASNSDDSQVGWQSRCTYTVKGVQATTQSVLHPTKVGSEQDAATRMLSLLADRTQRPDLGEKLAAAELENKRLREGIARLIHEVGGLVAASWIRDLTRECVERNPGPYPLVYPPADNPTGNLYRARFFYEPATMNAVTSTYDVRLGGPSLPAIGDRHAFHYVRVVMSANGNSLGLNKVTFAWTLSVVVSVFPADNVPALVSTVQSGNEVLVSGSMTLAPGETKEMVVSGPVLWEYEYQILQLREQLWLHVESVGFAGASAATLVFSGHVYDSDDISRMCSPGVTASQGFGSGRAALPVASGTPDVYHVNQDNQPAIQNVLVVNNSAQAVPVESGNNPIIVTVDNGPSNPVPVTIENPGGAATDVNVVGFQTQTSPVWTTDVTPGLPVIAYTPPPPPPPLAPAGVGAAAAEAARHNKLQHAATGNIDAQLDSICPYPRMKRNAVPPPAFNPFRELVTPTEIDSAIQDVLSPKRALDYAILYAMDGLGDLDINPFAPLAWDEVDLGHETEAPTPTRSSAPSTSSMPNTGRKPRARAGFEPVPRDPGHLAKQREAALQRVSARLRADGDDAVVAFLTQSPERVFAYDVTRRLWGNDWSADTWQRWFASNRLCDATQRDAATEFNVYARWHPKLKAMSQAVAWDDWFHDRFSASWVDDSEVLSAEADAHNQAMHSYNGNPMFSGGMGMVKEAPTYGSLYATPCVTTGPNPAQVALEVSTVPSSVNPIDQDVPSSMVLRGDIVLANNTVAPNQQLVPLETLTSPRQVRPGAAGALINSTNPLRTFVCGSMGYYGSALTDSDLITSIVASAIKANANLGRADNVALNGFHAFDLAYLGRETAYYGLNTQSAVFKLLLMLETVLWKGNRQTLPLSGEASLYDPVTRLNPAGALAVGYNNSPVFGEDCGGNAAVLPWRGGQTGRISFHLTFETVPEGERELAYVMNASLLLADDSEGLTTFLFAAMWSDYPLVLSTVDIPTLDSAGANGAQQRYVPHSAALYVPGQTNLHIVFPRRTAVRNPTAQAEANGQVLIRPRAGLQASANLVAGQLLDVNWVGNPGGLISYPLSEFAYTWMSSVDSGSLVAFMQRLNDICNITEDIRHGYERLASMAVRYPPMVSQALNLANFPAANSSNGWEQISPLGVCAPAVPGTWPQATIPRPDFLLGETDSLAWNKVACGLANVVGRPALGSATPSLLGNSLTLYWTKILARQQAVTMNVHIGAIGWTTSTWNQAYQNNDLVTIRSLIRGHYTSAVLDGLKPRKTSMGPRLASLFTALHGCSPTTDVNGLTVFDSIVAPRAVRQTIMALGPEVFLFNVCPVWLPDVWIHQTVRTVPRCFASYPPQNNADSTTGLVPRGYSTVILGGNTNYGPMLRPTTARSAARGVDTRDDTDEEIWNARLTCILVQATFRDLSGTPVPLTPVPGEFPKAMTPVPDYTAPTPAVGLRSSSTLWIPRLMDDGRYIYPTNTRGNMMPVDKIQLGLARASIEIWSLNGVISTGDHHLGDESAPSSMWLDLIRGPDVDVTLGGNLATQGKKGGDQDPAASASAAVSPTG